MKNKLFVILFVCALALPNLIFPFVKDKIDSGNHENRNYASFPALSLEEYSAIFPGIEAYYTDRLPFKNQLVRFHSKLDTLLNRYGSKYEILFHTPVITIGKDNWLFYTVSTEEEDAMSEYLGTNLYSEEKLQELTAEYQRIWQYFQEKDTEFLLFIPPDKEQVYYEYMPDNIPEGTRETRAKQLTDYLNDNTEIKAVYPAEYLIGSKGEYPLYYKYDTHWNNLGAFLAMQVLVNEMTGEPLTGFDGVEIREGDGAPIDLANMIGMGNDLNDDSCYTVSGFKGENTARCVEESEDGTVYRFTCDSADPGSVLFIGDSFRMAMLDYLAGQFKEVTVAAGATKARELLDGNHYDYVIFESVERCSQVQEADPLKLID